MLEADVIELCAVTHVPYRCAAQVLEADEIELRAVCKARVRVLDH